MSEKRDADNALSSFKNTAYWNGSSANGYKDGIALSLSGHEKEFDKLYKDVYKVMPSEEDTNKYVYDYIRNTWRYGDVDIRKDMTKGFFDRYIKEVRPEISEEISERTGNVLDSVMGNLSRSKGKVSDTAKEMERQRQVNDAIERSRTPAAQAEAMSRPGIGADKGLRPESGKGLADAEAALKEAKDDKAWSYVVKYHADWLREIGKKLRKDRGEDISQIKDVFLKEYERTQDLPAAWENTQKFVSNYFGDISTSYSNSSGYESPELMSSLMQERGIPSAYNMWNHMNNSGKAKPRNPGNIHAVDAEAMSRPGSGAAKGIGPESGKKILEADADAFMREQEGIVDMENSATDSGGATIKPDESLSSCADAVAEAKKIYGITGVPVSPYNSGRLEDVFEKFEKEGRYKELMQCKQAAVNIEGIYHKNTGTTEGDKIYSIFMYVHDILGFTWGGLTDDTAGEDLEDELVKRYEELSKEGQDISSKEISERMEYMKSVNEAFLKECEWYRSLPQSDAQARKRSIARGGADGKTGYSGMWVRTGDNLMGSIGSDIVGFAKAYSSVSPWDRNAIMLEGDSASKTWGQFADEVLGLANQIKDVNRKNEMEEGLLNSSRDYVYDKYEDAHRNMGITPEPVADTGEQEKPEEKGWLGRVWDAATGLFK